MAIEKYELPLKEVIPISEGGTGATTPEQARENLELGNMALEDNGIVDASISGKVITLTFADGTTKTLTTQDTGITCDYSDNTVSGGSSGNARIGQEVFKFSDGTLLIIGQAVTNTNAYVTITYDIPFIKIPRIVTTPKIAEGELVNWYSGTSDESNTSVMIKGSITKYVLYIEFIAIGRWK